MLKLSRIAVAGLVLLIATSSYAEAQQRRSYNPTPSRSSRPQQTRQTSTPNAISQQSTNAERQAMATVERQVRHIETLIGRETQRLDQELARANRVREQALKANNFEGLKQAEQMEQQAFGRYEAALKQIEALSQRLQNQSEAAANQQMRRSQQQNASQQRGNNQQRQQQQRQQPQQQKQQQQSKPIFRLFGF